MCVDIVACMHEGVRLCMNMYEAEKLYGILKPFDRPPYRKLHIPCWASGGLNGEGSCIARSEAWE